MLLYREAGCMLRAVGEGVVLRRRAGIRRRLRLPVDDCCITFQGRPSFRLPAHFSINRYTSILVQQDESLWQSYRTQLFRFVLRRVDDRDTAEDIVHDVLLRAYGRRDTLRDSGKFEPWLYQVTRNVIIDHYRRRRPSGPLPDDLAVADHAHSGSARRELAACMLPFINVLPEHYRSAITLSEIQGLTQQQTADQLGISLSGAKSRVQRARRMLEDKLLDCCRIEVDGRGSIADFERRNGNGCEC